MKTKIEGFKEDIKTANIVLNGIVKDVEWGSGFCSGLRERIDDIKYFVGMLEKELTDLAKTSSRPKRRSKGGSKHGDIAIDLSQYRQRRGIRHDTQV